MFTVIGQGFDGADFRFNDVELIPDKREYQPGDKVKLQVNTNRADSTVLLFVRPANGVYLPPQGAAHQGQERRSRDRGREEGHAELFVEAVTVAGGKVYTEAQGDRRSAGEARAQRGVMPSAETYKPGAEGQGQGQADRLRRQAVRRLDGDDRSTTSRVEYISGGSNVPEIKEFFWKWRRSHHVNTETSLDRFSDNLDVARTSQAWTNLGVFGETGRRRNCRSDDETADEDRWRSERRRTADAKGMSAARLRQVATAMRAAYGERLRRSQRIAEADASHSRRRYSRPRLPENRRRRRSNSCSPRSARSSPTRPSGPARLTTDEQGMAEVSLDMPENLTPGRVKVWGMGHGTKVGEGEAEVITRKDLIVRMQAPRFFVEKDEVVLSANVHNYLDNEEVGARSCSNSTASSSRRLASSAANDRDCRRRGSPRRLARQSQCRRRGRRAHEGPDRRRVGRHGDEVPGLCARHAQDRILGRRDSPGRANRRKITITVPKERRISRSRLEIRYSPTLAGAMVDALPYLVDYPYDSTEHTLNRFLPTVITQKVLLDMGLNLKAIQENVQISTPARAAARSDRAARRVGRRPAGLPGQ